MFKKKKKKDPVSVSAANSWLRYRGHRSYLQNYYFLKDFVYTQTKVTVVYLPVFLDFRRLLIIGAYSEFERLGLQDFPWAAQKRWSQRKLWQGVWTRVCFLSGGLCGGTRMHVCKPSDGSQSWLWDLRKPLVHNPSFSTTTQLQLSPSKGSTRIVTLPPVSVGLPLLGRFPLNEHRELGYLFQR